jgi:tetratricopeptide (TPR) repeat protein
MSYFAGDFPSVAHFAESALEMATAVASHAEIAMSCLVLGMGLGGVGEYERATALLEQGLASARRVGAAWLAGGLLNGLGELARSQGQYEEAFPHFEDALAIAADIRNTWLAAHVLDNIGHTAYSQQRYDQARTYFQRSLQASMDLGDERGMAMGIEKIGGLYAAEGHAEIAAQLLGAADALRTRRNSPVEGMDVADYQEFVQLTRDQLDEASFDAAWQTGQAMPLADVLDLVQEETP